MSKALVFPGQGITRFSGIVRLILKKQPELQESLNRIDAALGENFSSKLIEENTKASDEYFKRTSNSQPAIVGTSCLILDAWQKSEGRKIIEDMDYVVGHSLGEITGLVVNEGLQLEEAMKLARTRGIYMEQAVQQYYKDNKVPLEDKFKMVCLVFKPENFPDILSMLVECDKIRVSNINSSKQIVVVGLGSEIEKTLETIKHKASFKTIELPVEIPFHSSVLFNAQKKLEDYTTKELQLKNPKLTKPFISNYMSMKTTDTAKALEYIVRNTTRDVNFYGMIQGLYNNYNVRGFYGVGPGKITSHIDATRKTYQWDDVTVKLLAGE